MKRLIVLLLFATISSCTVTFVLPDQELKPVGDATLPDIETILDEDPERGGRIEGDSIPEAYGNKKVDDLPFLPTIADSIEFLTIHGTTGAKEWKRFTALTVSNFISAADSTAMLDSLAAIRADFPAGGGDVTTAQLADSTAAVRADFPSGGGASQLTDLTDVNTSTPTNRNVLIADGVDFESRALVEADISDLSHTTNTDAQTLSFSNPSISITGGNSVDISGIDTDTNIDSAGIATLGYVAGAHTTNTDEQTLSFSNPNLSITGGNSVDLSALSGGGGSGHVIADEGTGLVSRDSLNFVGAGVTVTDSGTATTVTIPSAADNLGDHVATQDIEVFSRATGSRPTGATGMFAYNSTEGYFEGYADAEWKPFADLSTTGLAASNYWTKAGDLYYNGAVGINNTSPSTYSSDGLVVGPNALSNSGNDYNFYNSSTISGKTGSFRSYGQANILNITGVSTGGSNNLAIFNELLFYGTGAADAKAVYSKIETFSGADADELILMDGDLIVNPNTTAETITGIEARFIVYDTVTTAAVLKTQILGSSAHIDNVYHLHIDRQGGYTTNNEYAIYSPDDIDSYFQGSIGIGDATPDALLDVAGDCIVTGVIYLNDAKTLGIFHGTGTPEGAVTASVGSTFHRTDSGASAKLYVKESGAGSNGWVAK